MVQSPILFLIFNRPDTTEMVFEQIKTARPSRLYIAADGPRHDKTNDIELCKKTRAIVEKINWDCTVKTLFRDENLGCKRAVSSAIEWFFSQEDEGIILEDDCLPAKDFFLFCDSMLEKYRFDTRMYVVTGSNLQLNRKWGEGSYYFSQCSNIWGWASWKRVWQKYDVALERYEEEAASAALNKIFTDQFLVNEWITIFRALKLGQIDTWDHQLHFLTFFENGLCITPNVNLISNIGFRADATHTVNAGSHNANMPTGEMGAIIHPQYFVPEKEADYFLLDKEFHLQEKWTKYGKDQLLRRRVKRWIKNIFK